MIGAVCRPVTVPSPAIPSSGRWGDPYTSRAGLRSKNPAGFSQNDTVSAGITGQSSGRVMWWTPNTYHSTTSAPAIGRFCLVQAARPSSRSLWLPNSPAGPQRAEDVLVEPEVGEDHDAHAVEPFVRDDLPGGLEAVEHRHLNVHQGDVRAGLGGRGDRLPPVG